MYEIYSEVIKIYSSDQSGGLLGLVRYLQGVQGLVSPLHGLSHVPQSTHEGHAEHRVCGDRKNLVMKGSSESRGRLDNSS